MGQSLTRRNLGFVAAGSIAVGPIAAAAIANAADMSGDWFEVIKAQHQELDRLLGAVKAAGGHAARVSAFKTFSIYLSAHSMAEEVTVYPALAITGSEQESKQLYGEQDDAKVLVARIGDALAMHRDAEVSAMLDTLANALHAHVAEEENTDFPALMAKEDAMMNAKLTMDFKAAFQRAVS